MDTKYHVSDFDETNNYDFISLFKQYLLCFIKIRKF